MLNRTAAVLLMLPLGAPLVSKHQMTIPVTLSDLNGDGVRLTSPLNPDFDRIARPLIGRRADQLFGLKPLLVLIANDTRKTVAAASVVFRVAKPTGGIVAWTNVGFPDVIVGDIGSEKRLGVRPHESIVVAQEVAVEDFDGPEPEEWYRGVITEFVRQRGEQLKDARSVTIELDAVIFDDGTLIGPDEDGKLAALFSRKVSAYQQWLKTVVDGLTAGQSVEAAFSPILKFQDEVRARQGSLRGLTADNRQAEVEKTNAAADVVRWRRRVGDAELPRILAGLRLSRFDVRR
jgi:hypothetical protein